MKLYVRYMVSIRCKMVVKAELEKLGIQYSSVELGEVQLPQSISPEQLNTLDQALKKSGLELMDDKKSILIEKIKKVIIENKH